jgi:4-alpha-glucanotransferase
MKWLRDYHEKIAPQLMDSEDLFDFIAHNDWVKPYALFKVLKDLVQQNSWLTWPEEWKDLTDEEFDELLNTHKTEISFYITIQYLCFQQLVQVKKCAEEKQVLIKGDIPILISPDSADVWSNLEFFDLSLAAGAPPDAYNPKGQYWGFPLYRWDIKKRSHFRWWKQRLGTAAHFYDCYRIDHVVGFFRIWAIKPGHLPTEGEFVPEDEDQWLSQGRELLEMLISSSNMLPIAEDLGVVPDCVRPCLNELGICGTKVMRWERRWKIDDSVIPIDEYPPLSLTCVSTHDSDTLQQWWKKFPDEAEVFAIDKGWEYQPDLTLAQRKAILWDSHHSSSLFHINLLQEYFALFPELVSKNPNDERINVPGEVLPTNWTYRFRPSIEEFTNHEGLLIAMQELYRT